MRGAKVEQPSRATCFDGGCLEGFERLASEMPMVVWTEPEHPLETAADPSRKRSERRSGGLLRRRSESRVRGQRERTVGMAKREIGRWYKGPSARVAKAAAGLSLLLAFGIPSVSHAQSASTWNKRGEAAEAREDYDAAFEAYRQAWLKKPKDMRYKERYERLRFQDANQHVDRGRVLRQSGDIGGAINEFARALQIDPGNQAAAQELELTQKPGAAVPSGPGGSAAGVNNKALSNAGPEAQVLIPGVDEETPHERQVQRDIDSLSAPVRLQPVSTDPITLHMVEDTKVIYQSICKAAGLNVIFDPKYTNAARIPVDLTNVSLYDALRIVGTLSKTFWQPVTPNTIYVAEDNPTNRREDADQAVQTFYLTNVSQQADANEILIALRNLLSQDVKLYLVASQNAIVVRATPDELVLAEKIINDLDRTKPEVVVDVAVLEVSRQKERNLGITLPQSFGLTPQASNANSTSTSTTGTTTTTGTSTTSTTSSLTLNTLANINATNFAVSVTGGQVNALLTDTDTRILQNPRIRATDGQRATLKIGSKIPVATGSYNAGVSTGVASLGVQTQFQYLDVGVNIDMTPTVHYDREISLKLKVEVSSQNGSSTISGVTEPIISQRSAEQTIQLKDGEPSLLAGILTNQDTKNVSGTPGLGELPILKYFFSSQDKIQQSDEIVFLIIPHIVRDSILTDENTEPIYVGTGQTVQLIRHAPETAQTSDAAYRSTPGSNTTAANAASAMLPAIAAAARPVAPPSGAAGAGNIPSGTAMTPLNLTVVSPAEARVGSTFQVTVRASNAHDLFGVPLQMQFDPKVLSLVNVDAGDLLGRDGQAVALVHRDEGDGAVTISATRPPNTPGVNGDGSLCVLTFKAIAPGNSALALVRIGARDSHQNSLPAVGGQANVRVVSGGPAPN